MDFVYVGSLQVLRSLKVMVISRDADNGFLALITFSAEFTDTDTGNLHTRTHQSGKQRTFFLLARREF